MKLDLTLMQKHVLARQRHLEHLENANLHMSAADRPTYSRNDRSRCRGRGWHKRAV